MLLPSPWAGPMPKSTQQPDMSVELRTFPCTRKKCVNGVKEYPYEPLPGNPDRIPYFEMSGRGPPPADVPGYPGDVYIDKIPPVVIYVRTKTAWEQWNFPTGSKGEVTGRVLPSHPILADRYLGKAKDTLSRRLCWYAESTLRGAGLSPKRPVHIVACITSTNGYHFENTLVNEPPSPSPPSPPRTPESVGSSSNLRLFVGKDPTSHHKKGKHQQAVSMNWTPNSSTSATKLAASSKGRKFETLSASSITQVPKSRDSSSEVEIIPAPEVEHASTTSIVKSAKTRMNSSPRYLALNDTNPVLFYVSQAEENEKISNEKRTALRNQLSDVQADLRAEKMCRKSLEAQLHSNLPNDENELQAQIISLKKSLEEEKKLRMDLENELTWERKKFSGLKGQVGQIALQKTDAEAKLRGVTEKYAAMEKQLAELKSLRIKMNALLAD
ncbi:hypothetical protein H0H93_009768 [Arthromyces matolae]|nr:hypothetical protein H0H93_009768 [Arthromyces matolae]